MGRSAPGLLLRCGSDGLANTVQVDTEGHIWKPRACALLRGRCRTPAFRPRCPAPAHGMTALDPGRYPLEEAELHTRRPPMSCHREGHPPRRALAGQLGAPPATPTSPWRGGSPALGRPSSPIGLSPGDPRLPRETIGSAGAIGSSAAQWAESAEGEHQVWAGAAPRRGRPEHQRVAGWGGRRWWHPKQIPLAPGKTDRPADH